MNSFKGIKVDEEVDEEITNDNQLRNKKKMKNYYRNWIVIVIVKDKDP